MLRNEVHRCIGATSTKAGPSASQFVLLSKERKEREKKRKKIEKKIFLWARSPYGLNCARPLAEERLSKTRVSLRRFLRAGTFLS